MKFIDYLRQKKKDQILHNLLLLGNQSERQAKFTTLQNEISIDFNTKVLGVTSIGEDKIAAGFAKALADTYVANGSSALIIDANLYSPCLGELLGKDAKGDEPSVEKFNDKSGFVSLNKEIYPSTVYKAGKVHKLIEEGIKEYEHVIVLVPSIDIHKEVALLADILDSVLLLSIRGITKKKDIFYALQFLYGEKLPVSKTVILK